MDAGGHSTPADQEEELTAPVTNVRNTREESLTSELPWPPPSSSASTARASADPVGTDVDTPSTLRTSASSVDNSTVLDGAMGIQKVSTSKEVSDIPAKLTRACRKGRLDVLQSMVRRGVDVNALSPQIRSKLLHTACGHGHADIVALLLAQGLDAVAKDPQGFTSLHYAAVHGHDKVVSLLLNMNPSLLNRPDNAGNSALHLACFQGRYSTCQLLLEHGASPLTANEKGQHALDLSSDQDIRLLLKRYKSIYNHDSSSSVSIDSMEATPLRDMPGRSGSFVRGQASDLSPLPPSSSAFATSTVDRRSAAEIERRSASHDPNRSSADHLSSNPFVPPPEIRQRAATFTSLPDSLNTVSSTTNMPAVSKFAQKFVQAMRSGDVSAVSDELSKQPNLAFKPLTATGQVAAHFAVLSSLPGVLHLVLVRGCSANAKDADGRTPLHLAAEKNLHSACTVLLEAGADVNAIDATGDTPMHMAARACNESIIHLLWSEGAKSDLRNSAGLTPKDMLPSSARADLKAMLMPEAEGLRAACQKGDIFTIRRMLTHNKKLLRTTDEQFQSPPLHVAAGFGQAKAVSLMIEMGADVNSKGKDGCTPLHCACTHGHTETAEILLAAGANVNAQDDYGFAPLHDAAQNERVQICILLKLHGADTDLREKRGNRPADLTRNDEVRTVLSPLGISKQTRNGTSSPPVLPSSSKDNVFAQRSALVTASSNTGTGLFLSKARLHDGQDLLVQIPRPANWTSDDGIVALEPSSSDYSVVSRLFLSTIVQHENNDGGVYSTFRIDSIERLQSPELWTRYSLCRLTVAAENGGEANEKLLFHGSASSEVILSRGFDERHAYLGGMFGAGIYFAEHSSKSNQYVFGLGGGTGCQKHRDKSCVICPRKLLLCRVAVGACAERTSADKLAHAPPGHHAVRGTPLSSAKRDEQLTPQAAGTKGLRYPEVVIYRGDQAYPEFVITYHLVR